MSALAERPLVDIAGQPIHDCPAAAKLSWAREQLAEYKDGAADVVGSDAADNFGRVLLIARSCADCRAEAEEGLDEILALAETRFEARCG